jgi:hypothetical protein
MHLNRRRRPRPPRPAALEPLVLWLHPDRLRALEAACAVLSRLERQHAAGASVINPSAVGSHLVHEATRDPDGLARRLFRLLYPAFADRVEPDSNQVSA